jgi:hypothetical protein
MSFQDWSEKRAFVPHCITAIVASCFTCRRHGTVLALVVPLALLVAHPAMASWSVVSSPNPSGSTESILFGVSCTSSTACIAVGTSHESSGLETGFAETWNGSSWNLSATPQPSGATAFHFRAVACSAANACTAVGSYTTSAGTESVLVERWNGSEWSIESAPGPSGALVSAFTSVSCVSAKVCVAVGDSFSTSGTTLAERWNGKEWLIQATPNTTNFLNRLEGVSCSSSKACTAVGTNVGSTLIERWNGSEWTIQTSANGTLGGNRLAAVSCPSTKACTAVGNIFSDFATPPRFSLAESWTGSEWMLQTTAGPSGETESALGAVSCVTPKVCTSTGWVTTSLGRVPETLANVWNGTGWSLESTPNAGESSELHGGVSCISSTECTAVGSFVGSGHRVTLVEVKS